MTESERKGRPVLTDGSTTLRLTIEGYQFPEIVNDKWDSNWLMVRVDVEGPAETWTQSDPGLLTWEVEGLADWLDSVAETTEPVADELVFLEPFLWFELLRDERRILVSAGYDRVCMRVPLEPHELRRCAESLRDQLGRFPRRGP